MKYTQAQIEAAQLAYDKLIAKRFDVQSGMLNVNDRRDALAAALTAAAAEVEKHDEIASYAINRSLSDASLKALSLGGKAIMERMADLEALAAAAEAGLEPHPLSGEAFTRWAHRSTPPGDKPEAGQKTFVSSNLNTSTNLPHTYTEADIIAAAIERCVQAIKDHPNMTDRAKEQAIAAIRAMKDQP